MEIKNREDYEAFKAHVKELSKNGIHNLPTEKFMELGRFNDAIAEYEENQKQLPDLSFITCLSGFSKEQLTGESSGLQHLKFSKLELSVLDNAIKEVPTLLRIAQRAAQSDPEAAQLLKDIANVNK